MEIIWLLPDHLNKTELAPTCNKMYWLSAPGGITVCPQIDTRLSSSEFKLIRTNLIKFILH